MKSLGETLVGRVAIEPPEFVRFASFVSRVSSGPPIRLRVNLDGAVLEAVALASFGADPPVGASVVVAVSTGLPIVLGRL